MFNYAQREVIPVDTHVHQIAMKHYGMNGSSKGKTAMNPKLYEAVSSKLTDIWGNYAGWAQTVSGLSQTVVLDLTWVVGFVHLRSEVFRNVWPPESSSVTPTFSFSS